MTGIAAPARIIRPETALPATAGFLMQLCFYAAAATSIISFFTPVSVKWKAVWLRGLRKKVLNLYPAAINRPVILSIELRLIVVLSSSCDFNGVYDNPSIYVVIT
ncbi:MAG: hypothetical protein OXR62_00530 [Ahrensia sp.]|nr:hypothetical protein [Ahrensia sp.]